MYPRVVYLLQAKCPQCYQGDLFLAKNPYKLSMLTKMPSHCPKCGQMTEPETGFYYGAMYCSYFISIALCLLNYFVIDVFLGLEGFKFVALNSLILILFWPLIFRYARVSYLYFFVSSDLSLRK